MTNNYIFHLEYNAKPCFIFADVKVTVSDFESYKSLSCITTCPYNPTYVWYRNGQFKVQQDRGNELYVTSGESGSYSCAVRGHEELRSPAVCVFDEKSCWNVTYSTQNICSLIGSSVDILCDFTFTDHNKVTKVFWFIKDQTGVEAVDVREDEEYQGRVQYTQISQNNCSLRITNLRERDAQTYRFRFYTDGGKYTGDPGVSLSVTDLKVTVSDWSEQYMNLSCITSCTLSNNPTYIWYKNGQRVSECKSASCSVAAVGGAVSYSCAVEGHDSLLSPPVYSPKNTRPVVLSSGDTVDGDSVTLSCSSDANPPVLTYSWFKQRAAADTLLTTGQNYSISNISSQHSGLYYCTAHNQLGQHNSTPTLLDVKGNSTQTHLDVKGNSTPTHLDESENYTVLMLVMVGLAVFLAVTLLSGALWMWKRKSSSANGHSSTGESGQRHSPAVYENVSASDSSGRVTSDDQDDVHYASVVFKNSHTQEVSLSRRLPPDTTDYEDVQYAAVNVSRSTAAIQLVADEAADDPSQLYSKIQKLPTSAV
ncbi:B-cell receptor CD22-like isoform X2 [Ictalurus furcatus]|uniref:B-cell receptor CD22-like isoform X2 n=1 Tax=Ictalurus furcatus TaxID=66913 RepID=UPI00234FE92D|nr:B-cell receptor CD22-like isoform X2 [Ictalurus furcatus]